MVVNWSENDTLFFKELKEGHQWQYLPAVFFQLHGLLVEVPELRVRDSIQEACKWKDSVDLIVNGRLIEVKSRNEHFTSSASFPYHTILVDTVSGYKAKETKPLAYVMISRPTGAMLTLKATSSKGWLIETKYDRIREIHDEFFVSDRANLQTLDCLVAFIKSLHGGDLHGE